MSLARQREDFNRMIAAGVPTVEAYNRAFPGGLSREKIMQEQASEQEKSALMSLAGQVAGVAGAGYGIPWAADKLGIVGSTTGSTTGSTAGGIASVTKPIPPLTTKLPGTITPVTGAAVPPVPPGLTETGTTAATNAVNTGTNAQQTGLSAWAANNPGLAQAMGGLGAAAGAYGMYKTLDDPSSRSRMQNAAQGAASGLGMGMGGAALLGATLGPVGLALSLLGGAALGGFAKDIMGDKDRWKTEQNKVKALREQGFNLPVMDSEGLRKGRSIGELVQLSQDQIDQGRYGNTVFARSRNVADLAPIDVQGSAAMYERAGKGQENNARLRYELAKAALAANAIQEGRGSQTIDWSKVADADKIIQQYGNLGNKGQMSNQEWERNNYEWVKANRPQLMSIYEQMPNGMFKQAPSDSKRRNEKRK